MKRGTPKTGKELSETYRNAHHFEKRITPKILEKENFKILQLDDFHEIRKERKKIFSTKYKVIRKGKTTVKENIRKQSKKEKIELKEIENTAKLRQIAIKRNQKQLVKLLKSLGIYLDNPNPRFFDYFCKKGNKYYLIETKLKHYTNHKYSLDRVNVSANQIIHFNKIPKNPKLILKILVGFLIVNYPIGFLIGVILQYLQSLNL